MAGKGKVLLMDDEQIILDVMLEIIRFLEYEGMVGCINTKKRPVSRLTSLFSTSRSREVWEERTPSPC
jgi:hypothetical protein